VVVGILPGVLLAAAAAAVEEVVAVDVPLDEAVVVAACQR
jgi:hypothetical protein